MFRSRSGILLRKVSGKLTACVGADRLDFGHATLALPSTRSLGLAFCAFFLLPVALLILSLFLAPAVAHAMQALGVDPVTGSMLGAVALAGTTETVSNELVEKRGRFAAKQKELGEVFQMAKDGSTYNFSRKDVLEKLGAVDADDAIAKVKSRNVELDNLGAELRDAELKHVEQSIGAREAARNQPLSGGSAVHAIAGDGKVKSFGEMFTESKAYVDGFLKGKQTGIPVEVDIGLKTLFQTSAGLAPESTRSGLLVEAATRPIQLLDLIPVRPISQAVDKYMAETTRTHSAAEKAEGATYAESTFVWEERTSDVRKITDSIPVTDEQIEDAPQVASLLDSRLRFGVRQRLDGQVWNGNGTSPNLRGLLNTSGIQTQAKGADPIFDAVFKAMMLVRFTGRALPAGLVFHPTDWQTVRLTRDSNGRYIMGDPSQPGPMSLFGLPVALVDAGTAGTALVGDFPNFCYVGERRGVEVQVGYTGSQFVEGKKTLRADIRACFSVTRAAAFCTITGL